MAGSDAPFQRVLDELLADPSSEFGASPAQVAVLRTVDGPFSGVQHVRVAAGGTTTHAYIKVLKPRSDSDADRSGARRAIEREYRHTRSFWESTRQDPHLGAVRPIAVLPELCAMVTEEVPGRPLADLLLDRARSFDGLSSVAADVGRWVRKYQDAGPVTDTIELAERRRYVDQRLQRLQGRALSASECRLILEQFDSLAQRIGQSVPAVSIHADLTPTNIVVDESGRVTVLDFTMAKTGTKHHDLAHLYFHLELMAARRRNRRVLLRRLQRSMLAGYDPALSCDDPLFRLMLLQHSVCHLVDLAERRLPIVDAAYRWFLRRRWRRCEQLLGVA